MTKTLIATIILTEQDKPVVTLIWPAGPVQRFTLHEHDWGADTWDWRHGHLPPSLLRVLRRDYMPDALLHAWRLAYVSPANVGSNTNEQGALMVYEIDYEEPLFRVEFEA